jgi:hypothetical protein
MSHIDLHKGKRYTINHNPRPIPFDHLNPHVYWHILYKFGSESSLCGHPDLSLLKRLLRNSGGPKVPLLCLACYAEQNIDIKRLAKKVLDS